MSLNRFFPLSQTTVIVAAILLLAPSVSAAGWKEKVLYSFQGSPDAATPVGGVVFDKAGNLYGAALGGPQGSQGTVFQLAPPAKKGDPWTESVLYVFQGKPVNDGQIPTGDLIIDSAGNLYGVTGYGGSGNCVLVGIQVGCGTVYELSPPAQKGGAWTETVLYSFPTPKQGYLPNGNLVFDSAGNLYGATTFGGGRGTNCNSFYQYCGAVFELSPPKKKGGKWTEKVLYGFKGVPAGAQFGDGANPNGGLVLDNKGAIYGTTYFGGNNQKGQCEGGVGGTGCGIVFELAPPKKEGGAWTEKLLHRFNIEDGSNPAAGVVFDGNGNLYGTTHFGPPNGFGLIFELRKPSGTSHSWKETVLHRFSDGNDGAGPMAAVVFAPNGNLYGTTTTATNRSAQGNVFQMKAPTREGGLWRFGVLYTFSGPPDGAQPSAALVLDRVGNVYGTTSDGGTGTSCGSGACGTVFELKP
jgi:hypothetical protein